MSDSTPQGRLVIVSNRLPVSLIRKDGKLDFEPSPGGLASGIFSYVETLKATSPGKASYIWVGWPGTTLQDDEQPLATRRLQSEYCATPVFLSDAEMDGFYFGFSNKTLWPLFHYFYVYSRFNEDFWYAYRRVNQKFCDVLETVLQPGDTVWIHDYHLLLLPAMLRKHRPDISIGFFLHIPFPSYETFRQLPKQWAQELIDGMLGSDLIGFHTYNYSQCFLRCALRIGGYENYMGQINHQGRQVKVDTFPMGIDYDRFATAAVDSGVWTSAVRLRRRLSETRIVLSIDRLDYTKGILNRLQGFELFLERNAGWCGKVTLLMVVVPSRESVEHYDQMRQQIDETVGRIQGRFGTMNWSPIVYQYRSLDFEPLVAAYAASDVALVTPLRDGMNLIAKEYVASCTDERGVLVLSEMAGAAEELGEALQINPNHVTEIADALKVALEMPDDEQRRRLLVMQDRLKRYNVVRWADDFMSSLAGASEERRQLSATIPCASVANEICSEAAAATRRLLLLDYDGTLVGFQSDPMAALPTPQVESMLRALSGCVNTEVAIISGRPRFVLEQWFRSVPVHLIAEHGAGLRSCEGAWSVATGLHTEWKDPIRSILEKHVDRLPGSFVEEKEFTLVWHYRRANQELASLRSKELIDSLITLTATNHDVQILHGNKVVEVRNASVHKGIAAANLVGQFGADFVVAIGDDWTDEDMFKSLPPTAHTIKVGIGPSCARYRLRHPTDVLELLEVLGTALGVREQSPPAKGSGTQPVNAA